MLNVNKGFIELTGCQCFMEKFETFLIHWLDYEYPIKQALKKAKLQYESVNVASYLVYMGVFDKEHAHWKNILVHIESPNHKQKAEQIYTGIVFLNMWFDTDMSYNEAIVASSASTALCDYMESLVEKGVFDDCHPDWRIKHNVLVQIEKDFPIFVEGTILL